MAQKANGVYYSPDMEFIPVCKPGELKFSVAHLNHGHIYAMTNGLLSAGAELVSVYEPDSALRLPFMEKYPWVRAAKSIDEILNDDSISLIASAGIPLEEGDFAVRVMESGKDHYSDKPGMANLAQMERIRETILKTNRKYNIYFGERHHVKCAEYANRLIHEGAIGRILNMVILAPHRLDMPSRPEWFKDRKQSGGILTNLGSHQLEQFLTMADVKTARVVYSHTANYSHKEYPLFEDFGEAMLEGDNGATCFFRVDWFTPDGLRAWGDGRLFVLGTEGYIELRKYLDLAGDPEGDHLLICDRNGERRMRITDEIGYPFFGSYVRDLLDRTENAMPQRVVLEAMRLALEAQSKAIRLE